MNNKKLYNNILSDISRIIKKKINENNELDIKQYIEYNSKYDFNYIDLKKLSKNIILILCNKILNSDFNINFTNDTTPKNTYGTFYIEYDPKNDDNLILLDSNEISITFDAEFDFEYDEGQEGDYWNLIEPINEYYYIKNVKVTNVFLTDTKNNFVKITDNNIISSLENIILNDNDIIEQWEYEYNKRLL